MIEPDSSVDITADRPHGAAELVKIREFSPDGDQPSTARRLVAVLRRINGSRRFQLASTGVIVFNAVLIGAETYSGVMASIGGLLSFLDSLCLAFFIVEIGIRLGGFGRRPWRYFASAWNVFDFVVVAAALVPGLRENVTLLRLLRLARVVRIVRTFPQLRVLLTAVWRSLPGTVGIIGIAGVLLYLYGMIGWILFGEAQPELYGSIGASALTLFMLMTMDNVADIVREGMEVTGWAVPFYLSFIVLGGFVLINLLIGVVITSMEEARTIEVDRSPEPEAPPAPPAPADNAEILARLAELQRAVEALSRGDEATHRPDEKRRETVTAGRAPDQSK